MEQLLPNTLPAFLDPFFDILADKLPPPVYDALFQLSSYALTFLSGLLRLASALPSYKPWEWDAQTVLPPLIVVLSAYWMLSSVYRTTTFFIRLAFRLLKWGTIFSVLGAAYTWLANGGAGNEVGDALNQFFGTSPRSRTGRSQTRPRSMRPKPWDSFASHQQWQYSEDEAKRTEGGGGSDVERAVKYIASLAGRAMTGSAGNIFRTFLDGASSDATGGNEGGESSRSRQKAKASSQRKTSSR